MATTPDEIEINVRPVLEEGSAEMFEAARTTYSCGYCKFWLSTYDIEVAERLANNHTCDRPVTISSSTSQRVWTKGDLISLCIKAAAIDIAIYLLLASEAGWVPWH